MTPLNFCRTCDPHTPPNPLKTPFWYPMTTLNPTWPLQTLSYPFRPLRTSQNATDLPPIPHYALWTFLIPPNSQKTTITFLALQTLSSISRAPLNTPTPSDSYRPLQTHPDSQNPNPLTLLSLSNTPNHALPTNDPFLPPWLLLTPFKHLPSLTIPYDPYLPILTCQ